VSNIPYTQEDLQDHHGIAAIIYDDKRQVLVQEHVKYGFWTIPVGKVRSGQCVQEALSEELLEECNITLINYREISCRTFHYHRQGKEVAVISHLFEVEEWSGILRNNEPHKHRRMLFLPLGRIEGLYPLSDLTELFLSLALGRELPAEVKGRCSQVKALELRPITSGEA
jgi:ADP-ribose pyrophosphatase YjhB (NUDIX family)